LNRIDYNLPIPEFKEENEFWKKYFLTLDKVPIDEFISKLATHLGIPY
jgi:hypothetical protein